MMSDKASTEYPSARAAAVANAKARLRDQQRYPYKGWYAVVIRPRREQEAADGFRNGGVAAYWPNYIKQVPMGIHGGARRHRVILGAIFPGLIFCPTADEDLFWAAIQSVPYVVNLVRSEGGKPATLGNGDIERIRQIEAGENQPPAVTPVHNFKKGQRVRFTDVGAFTDLVGKIISLAPDGRISIEVYLMARMVPMHGVLPHQIEVA